MVQGRIESVKVGLLRGWIWDKDQPNRQLVVEVLIDDQPIGAVAANLSRRDLSSAGIGDGRHGFEFVVPHALRDDQTHHVALRIVDQPEPAPIEPRYLNFGRIPQTLSGRVEGVRNGCLYGWIWDRASPASRIELEISARGRLVGRVTADRRRGDLRRAAIGDGCHGFEFPIEPSLIDTDDSLTLTVRTAPAFGGEVLGSADAGLFAVQAPAPVTSSASAQAQRTDESEATRTPELGTQASSGIDLLKQPALSATGESPAPTAQPSPPNTAESAPAKLSNSEAIALATKLESSGDLEGASAQLASVLALEVSNFEALFRMGRVTLARGQPTEAKAYAERAFVLKPRHAKPALVLARIAELEGQRLLALEYWKCIPANDSAYMERLLKSARTLTALERPQEARTLLLEAIKLKRGDVRPRRALAELLEALGDIHDAQEAWRGLSGLVQGGDGKIERRIEDLANSPRRSAAATLVRRYRDAMSRMERPIVLATGPDALDLLIARALGAELAAHFGAAVRIVVPTEAPAASIAADDAVAEVLVAYPNEVVGEVLFILPEFLTACSDPVALRAGLVYNYIEQAPPPGASLASRYTAYLAWIERVTGQTRRPIAPLSPLRTAGPVLIVDGPGTRRVEPEAIAVAIAEAGFETTIELLSLHSNTEWEDLLTLATAAGTARLVVIADGRAAQVAAGSGALVLLAAGFGADILPPFRDLVRIISDESQLPSAVIGLLGDAAAASDAASGRSPRARGSIAGATNPKPRKLRRADQTP